MKTKHTAGNWKIKGYAGEHDESGAIIVCGNKTICTTSGGLKESSSSAEWAEYYANAELISKAPDMAALIIEFANDDLDRISPGFKLKCQELLKSLSK